VQKLVFKGRRGKGGWRAWIDKTCTICGRGKKRTLPEGERGELWLK